jgi:hypothetical protein
MSPHGNRVMNRRSFIASAAALLVPTWRLRQSPAINLSKFCETERFGLYDMSKPFEQLSGETMYAYGTTRQLCVRVLAKNIANEKPDRKIPPANRLPWIDSLPWEPWPEKQHLLAAETICPTCAGACIIANRPCDHCGGCGEGIFPGLQKVGSLYVDPRYDALIRQEIGRCEYAIHTPSVPGLPNTPNPARVYFRFGGGEGMLMPLTTDSALRRLQAVPA